MNINQPQKAYTTSVMLHLCKYKLSPADKIIVPDSIFCQLVECLPNIIDEINNQLTADTYSWNHLHQRLDNIMHKDTRLPIVTGTNVRKEGILLLEITAKCL
jgi:hypothetical protein